jgi:hypothetical protein
MGTGGLSLVQTGRNMKLNIIDYPEPRLRMSGVIPPLPIPVFMEWIGKIFSFLHFKNDITNTAHKQTLPCFD